MSKDNNKQILNGYCIGRFGLSWRGCDESEVNSFGYIHGPAVPSALSGSFASFEDAKAEVIERNKRIFI